MTKQNKGHGTNNKHQVQAMTKARFSRPSGTLGERRGVPSLSLGGCCSRGWGGERAEPPQLAPDGNVQWRGLGVHSLCWNVLGGKHQLEISGLSDIRFSPQPLKEPEIAQVV